jgi:hypothetical protein
MVIKPSSTRLDVLNISSKTAVMLYTLEFGASSPLNPHPSFLAFFTSSVMSSRGGKRA